MRGFHGQMLLVFDEGPGIRQDLWTAAEGISAAGDVRWLVLGNPLPAGGPYQQIFADPSFTHITIDAFETPNLAGLTLPDLLKLGEHELDDNVRPYLITRRWVKERYEAWGEESEEWQALVRGQFANNPQTALIWSKWLTDATGRLFAVPDLSWRLQAGLDVAGPGEDETVLRLRLGPKILRQWTWHEGDTLRLLGAIRAALSPYRDALYALVVDAAGIGWHLGGSLVADYGRRVVLINVGESSRFPRLYARLKDELYWGLRERFQSGDIGGALDDVTMAQLADVRYHHTVRGLIEIESKDEARKRGVHSPDRAEALMLAFAPIAETRRPTSIRVTA